MKSSFITTTSDEIYRDGTYLRNNQGWHVEDSPWKAQQVLTMLGRAGLQMRSVCEVGCGAGEILNQLSRHLPLTQFVGYELSPQAFELCRQRESERVCFRLADLSTENVVFDCLLCMDVVEHVEDYFGFLRGLKAKSTYKIFHFPLDVNVLSVMRNEMMRARRDVGHLHYFTRDTALATLADCGYQVLDSFYTKSFIGAPQRSVRARLAKLPRSILFRLSPHWAVKLLGGSALLVLAR